MRYPTDRGPSSSIREYWSNGTPREAILKNTFLHFPPVPTTMTSPVSQSSSSNHSRAHSCPPPVWRLSGRTFYSANHSIRGDSPKHLEDRQHDPSVYPSAAITADPNDEHRDVCTTVMEKNSSAELVKRRKQLLLMNEKEDGEEDGGKQPVMSYRGPPVTLMIRNIPTKFTAISFVKLVEDGGFHGKFDFFYLPIDYRTRKNVGYAFINFITPQDASNFTQKFQGACLRRSTSRKSLHVSASRHQGLMENLELFRSSKLITASIPYLRPLVAIDGVLRPLCEKCFAHLDNLNQQSPKPP